VLISEDYAKRLAGLLLEGKLVLFVGAGISLQAKPCKNKSSRLPLWAELAQRVAKMRGEKLLDYGGDILDLFDSVQRKNGRLKLEDAVRAAIPEDEFAPGPVHDLIADLPWRRIYTTNYDNLLSRVLKEKSPVVTEQDFEFLTGRIRNNRASCIFTERCRPCTRSRELTINAGPFAIPRHTTAS